MAVYQKLPLGLLASRPVGKLVSAVEAIQSVVFGYGRYQTANTPAFLRLQPSEWSVVRCQLTVVIFVQLTASVLSQN